jgi:hypothetical protein
MSSKYVSLKSRSFAFCARNLAFHLFCAKQFRSQRHKSQRATLQRVSAKHHDLAKADDMQFRANAAALSAALLSR